MDLHAVINKAKEAKSYACMKANADKCNWVHWSALAAKCNFLQDIPSAAKLHGAAEVHNWCNVKPVPVKLGSKLCYFKNTHQQIECGQGLLGWGESAMIILLI